MPARRRWWREVGPAAAGGAWALVWLVPGGPAAAVVLPAALAGSLVWMRRRVVAGALGVAAAMAAGRVLFDVAADNPWDLAAALIALCAVGRHGPARAAPPVVVAL